MSWLLGAPKRGIAFVMGGGFVACGGVAVIDPGGGGAGGAGATGGGASTSMSVTSGPVTSSQSGPSVGSTSSGPVSCGDFTACCFELCDLMSEGPCPPQNCGCEGFDPGEGECEDAITDWYQCLVATYPSSISCEGGQPTPACGPCDTEAATVSAICGFELPCGGV